VIAPAYQHEPSKEHPDLQSHSHPHSESHSHSHDDGAAGAALSAEQAQLGPTGRGTVVLDIGGNIGSLIIMTSAELAGAEIEISPVGHDDVRTHIAIRERLAPGGTRWAGIFPGLQAGRYMVWDLTGKAASTVEVVGGQVSQLDWR
jgi:hypothetical protein